MSTQFNYQVAPQAEQYVKISANGSAGKNEILAMYRDVCAVAIDNGCKRLFVDATQITLDFPMTEFVPIMKELTGMLASFKVARLCNVFEFRQDLIENVSGKSNLELKNFTTNEEALAWLLT